MIGFELLRAWPCVLRREEDERYGKRVCLYHVGKGCREAVGNLYVRA